MKKTGKTIFFAAGFFVLFLITTSYAGYSHGPRQTGAVVLDELLMGPNQFVVSVGSGGCTSKDSLKVDVKQEKGLTSRMPHYVLTIRRVKPDECKAIQFSGTLILFVMEKDLGIKGNYTYSLTNPVYSLSAEEPSEESLFSIVEKHFTFNFPEYREIRPEPYETFEMDNKYFSCLIPVRWKMERDKEGDEKAGIYEITLTRPDDTKPEEGERYFLPKPFIYAGYYTKNNNQKKTFERFTADYEKHAQKKQDSDRSRYEKPKDIKFNGREAKEYAYEVYQDIPRGPLFTTKYWLKAKFIVVKARDGFYVLAYKSPSEFYEKYLPVFEEVVKSFKPGD